MSCLLSLDWPGLVSKLKPSVDVNHWLTAAGSTFGLVAAAEFGDKSQLVCMTLAARHRAVPVLLGAFLAFGLLNLAAVLFGAAVARWIPAWLVGIFVVILFALFGLRALLTGEADEEETCPSESTSHSVVVSTFLLIFTAEFGDKTQLAVAGMGAALPPVAVWMGGTAGLMATTGIGVWAGRALLRKMPMHWLHRLSGLLFLVFAAYAGWQVYLEGGWQNILVVMQKALVKLSQ